MRLIGSNKVVCKEGKWRYLGGSPPRCEVGKKNKTKKTMLNDFIEHDVLKKLHSNFVSHVYFA